MYFRGGGISNSRIVTEEGKYSLDAVQNNPDVDDTLAYKLNKLYSNIYYKQGDKILKQRIWTGGTLTSSGHEIYFTIPVYFITDAIPVLELIAVQARYNGGYLVGTSDPSQTDFSDININSIYHRHTGFEITLSKETGYLTDVNNVPLAISCCYSIDFV